MSIWKILVSIGLSKVCGVYPAKAVDEEKVNAKLGASSWNFVGLKAASVKSCSSASLTLLRAILSESKSQNRSAISKPACRSPMCRRVH